jgi:hypothetical protein
VRPLARPMRRALRCRARNHHFASYTAHTFHLLCLRPAQRHSLPRTAVGPGRNGWERRSRSARPSAAEVHESQQTSPTSGSAPSGADGLRSPPQTSLHSRRSSIRRAPDRSVWARNPLRSA